MALLWIPLISRRPHYLRYSVTLGSLAALIFFPSLDQLVAGTPHNQLLPWVTADEENALLIRVMVHVPLDKGMSGIT